MSNTSIGTIAPHVTAAVFTVLAVLVLMAACGQKNAIIPTFSDVITSLAPTLVNITFTKPSKNLPELTEKLPEPVLTSSQASELR